MNTIRKVVAGDGKENDGRPARANTSPTITGGSPIITGGSPNITGGSSTMRGTDRTREQARSTTTGQAQPATDDQWQPLGEMPGFSAMRGDVERLQGHGVTAGIVNGVLVIARKDVPRTLGFLKG